MPYEFKQADVYDFANTFSTPKKEKGSELFFTYCPYCNGGGHDKDTFSINLDTGTFNCFRSSCGKQGHFVELARDFNFQLDMGEVKEYKRLPQKPIEVRSKAIEYLASRGISEDIVKRYSITTQIKNPSVVVFPFYDENNVMQFVKYRNTSPGAKPKEFSEKDTKPILFGMVQCVDFGTVVITEGQIDSLSLAECGINNAVSVPTGARGFTWYRHCSEWLAKFKDIIVFGDNEKGKITLVDELQARVSQKIRVVRVQDYLGEKDANAILQKYGKDAVVSAVKNAEVIKLKNIKDLSEVKSVDINSLPKIKTNMPEIDRVIGGLYYGQVILLSGQRGNGKSTFMSQMVVEAIEQDCNVFVYSGELADYHFKRWIDFQIAGPDNVITSHNEYGDEVYSISDANIELINKWYKGKAYIYDNNYIPDNERELESLVVTVEKAIQQYDVKLICIDNLMTAIEPDNNDLYRQQSKFVGDLKKIAMKYNVVIILVAHPRKSKEKFDNDDVSGSADITNKVDVVMSYGRCDETKEHDGELLITKNRLTGKLAIKENAIGLFYSAKTKRITSYGRGKRHYGWKDEEWQAEQGEQLEYEAPF